jgi:hypothetical protein
MKMLKEPIAWGTNAEDGVRGHSFAERLDSPELEDDEQILITSLHINGFEVNHALVDSVDATRRKSVVRPVDEGGNRPIPAA